MFDDRTPIYQQIAARLKQDILDGTLAEGDQVMSTNQFATYYRINPATAAKGFHQLVDEGVLYKKRGLGMYVTDGARAKLLAERRERFFSDMVDPMAAEAGLIGVPLADVVAHLEGIEERRSRM
ncbi:GntR family transcriptional regulator [Actinorhabdospora filicis]|uniref:GntR family transcriptional regulator n=1 Tax=Actinorhabdospora filicis TaxID=1785913 RepID=A0A9W6SGG7_9ACTN|nr:GntR family transcriptional regulator [Actinorhabdospora filicis]GLZ75858.1 GntR family transcriptional regulator [Actinorhabdospora filicis]